MANADTQPFSPEDIAALLGAATAAPSVHNSQPWRFRDRPDAIELHLDTERALPCADPDGREQVISCAASLFNLRLALAHLGYEPLPELLPDRYDRNHLATVTRGPRRHETPADARLHAAIPQRRSYRRPFRRDAVPRAVLDELAAAALREGARLVPVVTPHDHGVVADLAAAAAQWLLSDPGYRGELGRWTRYGSTAVDGLGLAALGEHPYPVNGLPWALLTTSEVAVDELRRHPLLVLTTATDSRLDWLAAGQALQRVLLTLTARGLAASLLTQVSEVDATRAMLAHHLGLPGVPQVTLRIGHPVGGVPRSGRRRLRATLLPDR